MNDRSLMWRLISTVFRFFVLVALLGFAPKGMVRFLLFSGPTVQDPEVCRSLVRPLDGFTGPAQRSDALGTVGR